MERREVRTFSIGIIFNLWKTYQLENYVEETINFILNFYNKDECTDVVKNNLKKSIRTICSKLKKKWAASHRKMTVFMKANKDWLDSPFKLPAEITGATNFPKRIGRPVKDFEVCVKSVQRKKAKRLLQEKSSNEILLAAEMSMRADGKRDAAHLIKELAESPSEMATSIKKMNRTSQTAKRSITPEEALSLIINSKLSVHQYNLIRQQAKNVGYSIYPSYYQIKSEKKKCYPPEEKIHITESSGEIELQDLLNLTINRLFQVIDLEFFKEFDEHSCKLICKWGLDGSSGQSRYKQRAEDGNFSDENVFSISFVPLRLVADTHNKIIWQNKKPSSTRYCRIIRFIMHKETTELILSETQRIVSKIENLMPTFINVNGAQISVRCEMLLTMVDGKVCSALSEYSSSQVCYICGATPKEMNNVEKLKGRTPVDKMYEFGISPLHAYIRSFEFLLHLSYKLTIRKWQARLESDKLEVNNRKMEIQNKFRTELGLLVDMPKQGTGNTNDGNTARRFFCQPEKTAAITGINVDIVRRFSIILKTIASGCEIDADKFSQYAEETLGEYINSYSWYYLPATVHKILLHASEIIKTCIIPLGQLSEEAQEARNKDYRNYRQFFSRKTSREDTNRDILNRLIISSDPVLSSNYIKSRNEKSATLSPEVINLLVNEDLEPGDNMDLDESE